MKNDSNVGRRQISVGMDKSGTWQESQIDIRIPEPKTFIQDDPEIQKNEDPSGSYNMFDTIRTGDMNDSSNSSNLGSEGQDRKEDSPKFNKPMARQVTSLQRVSSPKKNNSEVFKHS